MKCILLIAIMAFVVVPASAQGDLLGERASLRGVNAFFVDVTVEGPRHLAESDLLTSASLIERLSQRLASSGISARPRTEGPHLHIHLNTMEVEGGLIPFAINADFYQPVRLDGNTGPVSASTWDEGVVGLVSRDRLSLILESIDGLVDQFASDFVAVNRSNKSSQP